MFAFILFTEGFGYWKAILSCEKYKSSKETTHPSALGTNTVPTKNPKHHNFKVDLSNLSKQGQGKNYFSNVLTTEIDDDKLEREAFYY